MEFSLLFVFVTWTTSMSYLTSGKERDREMLFPQYYFFAERRLVNHTMKTVHVIDLDQCELLCYLNDDCVSLNIKKDQNDGKHECELNNSTHLEHDIDLLTDAVFYYRGSKNLCGKSPPCHNNATCQSGFTNKGYRCSCTTGFHGEYCEKDIDECNTNSHNCDVEAVCNNTNGSFVCTCKPGYTGDGRNCTDIDECKTNSHNCDVDAVCNNTNGSFVCTCKPGYTGDGRNCTDIDECSTTSTSTENKCHADAACINTPGTYNCTCKPKYIGDGFDCKDDPCQKYTTLNSSDRHLSNSHSHLYPCDNTLPGGWYRFEGPAGNKMPIRCTRASRKQCGTNSPGWINVNITPLPGEDDGEREGIKVCFPRGNKCCKESRFISVKNCGPYYVYWLSGIPGSCHKRYCGTD